VTVGQGPVEAARAALWSPCDCPEAQTLRAVLAELEKGPGGAALGEFAGRLAALRLREASHALSEGRDWSLAGGRVTRPYSDADVPDWARPSNAKLALTRANASSATDATTDPD
jgi:hypothetical protein